jgi:hypothetical protein
VGRPGHGLLRGRRLQRLAGRRLAEHHREPGRTDLAAHHPDAGLHRPPPVAPHLSRHGPPGDAAARRGQRLDRHRPPGKPDPARRHLQHRAAHPPAHPALVVRPDPGARSSWTASATPPSRAPTRPSSRRRPASPWWPSSASPTAPARSTSPPSSNAPPNWRSNATSRPSLATAAERARIAREMHDIIGHNLSVITSLADGGSYAAAKNPERAAQALTAIGTTSRQALGELRRLLDVLRTPAETQPPQPPTPPGLARVDGPPALPHRPRPPHRRRTLRRPPRPHHHPRPRHRPPPGPPTHRLPSHPGSPDEHPQTRRPRRDIDSRGVVRGRRRRNRHGDRHRPRKDHDATATATAAGNGTGGRGLTGMRERTALYGGTLESGPLPDHGWRVHLHLPEEPPQ